MAAGAGLCVASNYFCQPLLALFVQAFHITPAHAALLVTFTQLGYIAGLVFLVPLGDLLDSRLRLVACPALSAVRVAASGLAPNFPVLVA
jgi:predicted MFS family arabinose efflux permease